LSTLEQVVRDAAQGAKEERRGSVMGGLEPSRA
jgi:hypothetical protein